MELTFDQIASAACGAVRAKEKEDGLHLYRFTEEQNAFYREKRDLGYNANVQATAGMKLRFRTDSPTLKLELTTSKVGSRQYFAADVFANGTFVGSLQNYDEAEILRKYVKEEYPLGDVEGTFDLGEGEKEVSVYLPWSVRTVVRSVELADGASFLPVRPEKKLLWLGDSISQGFDALHPSRRMNAQLADWLGMEEVNKAIGGEVFQPDLAAAKDAFTPALIVAAYGSNDWRKRELEQFHRTCRGFFENLREAYPGVPIVAVTPIWRKICYRIYECGPFRGIDAYIKEVAASLPGITVIDAYDFVPHDSDYFGDLTLHPNGAGFDRYFENLKPYFEAYR